MIEKNMIKLEPITVFSSVTKIGEKREEKYT